MIRFSYKKINDTVYEFSNIDNIPEIMGGIKLNDFGYFHDSNKNIVIFDTEKYLEFSFYIITKFLQSQAIQDITSLNNRVYEKMQKTEQKLIHFIYTNENDEDNFNSAHIVVLENDEDVVLNEFGYYFLSGVEKDYIETKVIFDLNKYVVNCDDFKLVDKFLESKEGKYFLSGIENKLIEFGVLDISDNNGKTPNSPVLKGTLKLIGSSTSNTTNLGMSTGTSIFNTWTNPERIAVNEYHDRIEMIYKQTSTICYTSFPAPPPEVRLYKIIFSCIDGKWNKSAPIYGKIIPAREEYYEFEDEDNGE